VSFEDRTLTCAECGTTFVWAAGEQAFYAEKGFGGAPQRCPACRAKRGAAKAPTIAAFAERLADPTRRALTYAEEEARRLEHRWIGTEHLLLGLLRDMAGTGGRVLRRLGVDLDETRAAVAYWAQGVPAEIAPRGPTPLTEAIGLAQRAVRALELAITDAATRGAGPARPEHLLLALLHGQGAADPGRGVAAAILESAGVTAEKVQAELPRALAEDGTAPEHPYRLSGAGKWKEATQSLTRWREERRQGRRYSLVMPEELFAEVERLAERQQTSVVELLRRFTRLGLLAMELQARPDASLVIREGGTERVVLLL
jgi:hypothetical protein